MGYWQLLKNFLFDRGIAIDDDTEKWYNEIPYTVISIIEEITHREGNIFYIIYDISITNIFITSVNFFSDV